MNVFAPVEAACKQLRTDPGLRMLRILVEPDLDDFFQRWLEQWDRSEENDQIVLRLDAPFTEDGTYLRALYDAIQRNRSDSAGVLAENDIQLPAPVQFNEADDQGLKSFVAEVAQLAAAIEGFGGQLVLAVTPAEITNALQWCRRIETLLKEFSVTPVKLAACDRPAAPRLESLVGPRNPIAEGIKSISFKPDPESLQAELESDLKKPLKPLERVNTLLMLAGFDVGFGRLDEASKRYEQALLYCQTGDLKAHESVINFNLGGVKLSQNDAKSAMEQFERAGHTAVKMENYPLATSAAMAMGECHERSGDPEQALRFFEQGARLASLAGVWQVASQANLRFGQALAKSGRHEEASTVLERAKEQLTKLGEPLHAMAQSMLHAVEAELAKVQRQPGRT
jgi:tetratricopeptide (TPR) repeat protein